MLNTTIRALLYITIIHGWLGVGAESSHQKEYMEAAGRSRKLQQANDTEMVEVAAGPSTMQVPTVMDDVPDQEFYARLKVSAQPRGPAPPIIEDVPDASIAQYTDPAPNQFVKRRASDGMLELGGKLFYSAGANNYGLAAQGEVYRNATYLRQIFTAYRAAGVTVIRTWCFCDGRGEYEGSYRRPFAFQAWNAKTGQFVYYDKNVQQLDLVIREAKRAGIRIICALGNNWEAFGGKRYYMKSIYGANNNVPEDEFFIRTRAIWAYKRWISYLLNRVNVYTKVAYKNEPTILAWNVINEPTISYQFDKKRGLPTGSTLRTWVNDMIEHIRVKEQAKQLVFVGDIGERTDAQRNIPLSYVNTGYHGGDANAYVCSLKNRADAATVHFYAAAVGVQAKNATWYFNYFMANRCRMARLCGRTCILEEVGEIKGFFADRNLALRRYTEFAWYHGAQIVLFWQLWPRSVNIIAKDPFDFKLGSADGGIAAQQTIADAKAKLSNPSSNLGYVLPRREASSTWCFDMLPIPGRNITRCNSKQCKDDWGAGYCMRTCKQCKFQELWCPAHPPFVKPKRTCKRVF